MERQYVHLSVDVETAIRVGRRHTDAPVVIAIQAAEAWAAGVDFYKATEAVYLSQPIPLEFLEQLEIGGEDETPKSAVMKKIILSKSGFLVSRLSMGTDTGIEPVSGGRLLKRALELGVNFWDTDETYGTLPTVREALQQVDRSQVVLAAKTYEGDYHGARRSLENTLATLKTDYLDIFHLHAVRGSRDFEARRGALEALLEARGEGLIRAVGLSTHAVGMVETAAGVEEIEVVLAILNRTGAHIVGGRREEMEEALRRVYRANKGVYLMKVLARGRLVNELEEALGYALRFPYAHSVCVGMRTVQELEANVSLAERIDRGR